MTSTTHAYSAPPPSALVLGEVQSLLTALRRNRKWQTVPLEYNGHSRPQPAGSLTHALTQLRHKLTAQANPVIDPLAIVRPFLAVVSSAETSGHLTALALQSLHRLLSITALFPTPQASSAAATRAIVASLSHCRYESTDSSKDELVLSELLSLVAALLHSTASSAHLTSDTLWSLHKTTYRIYRYMRPADYSELLCNQAEQTLVALVKHIYGHTEAAGGAEQRTGAAERYGAVQVQMMEFICTLAEISHADVGFVYSLSQGLPVPPYLNATTSSPASTTAHSSTALSSHTLSATGPIPLTPTTSSPPPPASSANAYFPSRRILLPSSDLLDLGLLTLPPPPLSLPSSHFPSPAALSKAVSEWTRRTVFTTQLLQAVVDSPPLTSPHLLSLVDDCVCKFLLRNCRTQQSVLYAATLRCFYSLVLTYRHRLHMQIEVMLNSVYLRQLHSKAVSGVSVDASSSSAYDLKELTLESLFDLCRLPWWWSELYINYDSRLSSSNVYENLVRSLCKSVFPVHGCMTANHVLAMRCLLEGLKHLATTHVHIPHAAQRPLYLQLLSDLRAARQYKRLLQSCVDEFNKKPKRGIALLQSSLQLFLSYNHLKTLIRKDDAALITPAQRAELASLASFLRYTPGLDKAVIGQFIAEPGPASAMLLEEYLSLFDFSGQSLDDALRMFIEAFRLPVEAQQIDRVLQAFALQYHRNNPTLLAHADVVHTLSFSLIMLNTDAHNEQIRNKMTLEQFISNNRGINAGGDVPRQLLEGLYFTIKKREIKMSGDGLTGDVSDALWCDLLSVSRHWMSSQPYIRLDRLGDEIASFAAAEPMVPPQLINGHVIGCTLYRPPGPLPTGVGAVGLPESPVASTRQVTLSELTRTVSSNDTTPSIYSLSMRDTGVLNTSDSAGTADGDSVDGGGGAAVAWMEEDQFVESWTAANAALSMVYDLLQVDTHGHSVVESATDITEDDDGWNKVDSSKHTGSSNTPDGTLSSTTTAFADAEEDDGDENLLSYVHVGFTLLASVAAEYDKRHIMDKLISSLCNLTGLPGDYRSDSSQSASTSASAPHSSPMRSPTASTRTASPLLRFSSQPKAQWSLALLFSLVHAHMDSLRDSWKDVLVCVLQLQAMNILPANMLRLDDHVGWLDEGGVRLKGRSRLLTQLGVAVSVEERPSAVSALFTSMSSYFMYGGGVASVDESATRSAEEADAERRARECVEKCNIGELLTQSGKMDAESLSHLLSAIVDVVPVSALRQSVAETRRKRPADVPSGKGEARVCAGGEEGEGYELGVLDEDAVMTSDGVYASESDKEKLGEQCGSAVGCSECACHSLLTPAIAVEVRRALLCHQLLNEVASHNVDRLGDSWPHIRHYLVSLVAAPATSSSSSSSPPHSLSAVGRSSSTSSLTPIRELHGAEPKSATPSSGPMSPPPHAPSKSASYGVASANSGGAVSLFVVESAVTSLLSITSRLLSRHSHTTDLLSPIVTLPVDLSHTAPSTQLLAGLLSLVRTYTPLFPPPQLAAVLDLLSSSAAYHHTYTLGWHVLSDVLRVHRGRHLSLHSLAHAAKAVQAFGTSRWCSAALSSSVVELLWQLYERAKSIAREERDKAHSDSSAQNGDVYNTPLKRAQAASPPTAPHAAPFSTPSSSPVHSMQSSASLRPFQQLWQQACLPVLSSYRNLITSFTSRIRLLHSAHLRASRSNGPGVGGGTHSTPAPSASTTADGATTVSTPRSSLSYRGFIGYVQGFGDARRKALMQLRQILILDDFSALVCDAATQQATQRAPHVPDHTALSSSHPAPAASPLLSLTSTSFWQLCLDSIVFPALSSLASPHPIDLELTDDLTTARSHCINLLEKIFLLHLPLLLRWEGAEGGGTGFSACWLHVLKSMDGLMHLGLRRERVIMERHKRSVYDRKRERRRSEQQVTAADDGAGTATPAVAASEEWDGLDGGVLLTESVEEALKNLLLVMKASRVFGVSSGGGVLNGELWELTWAIVDPVLPHLKLALFPEMQQLQTPPAAAPAQAHSAVDHSPAADNADATAQPSVALHKDSEPSLSLPVAAAEASAHVTEPSQAVAVGSGAKEAGEGETKQQYEVSAVNGGAGTGQNGATAAIQPTPGIVANEYAEDGI